MAKGTGTLAITWHGRRGSMLLGPTEDRVARWLDDRTRYGRVAIRTVDLAAALGLERSEAYRITARLRVLGLFGIENDKGGNKGGRRYWRTATDREADRLDAVKHRVAWSRIVAWARARRRRIHAALAAHHTRQEAGTWDAGRLATAAARVTAPPAAGIDGPADDPPSSVGPSFRDAMLRHGLGELMREWRIA